MPKEIHLAPGARSRDRLTLWWARCSDIPTPEIEARFLNILSDDERRRYRAYVHAEDRHVYLLAHAILRVGLSKLLERPPESFLFVTDDGGKPRLADRLMEFSISHTRGLAICCFAYGLPVGVDVEHARRAKDLQRLVPRYLTSSEEQELSSLSGRALEDRLVYSWTCKEALVKAAGRGLAIPLRDIELRWSEDGVKAKWAHATCNLRRFRIGDYLGSIASFGSDVAERALTVVKMESAERAGATEVSPGAGGIYTISV